MRDGWGAGRAARRQVAEEWAHGGQGAGDDAEEGFCFGPEGYVDEAEEEFARFLVVDYVFHADDGCYGCTGYLV